jgi:cytochrome b561
VFIAQRQLHREPGHSRFRSVPGRLARRVPPPLAAPTPLASILIHGGITLLRLLLFARAFVLGGLFAWSVGVVYVGYDTALPRIGWLTAINPADKDYWHDLLGAVHTSFAYVLYAMVAAHVAGALKHQWCDEELELQRMPPSTGASAGCNHPTASISHAPAQADLRG